MWDAHETPLARQAALEHEGPDARVLTRQTLVSLPLIDVFELQSAACRHSVLARAVRRRLAVEAGATLSWWRYVGTEGRVIGLDDFGVSGQGPERLGQCGFTAERVGREVGERLETAN